jgi:hypothetical protein
VKTELNECMEESPLRSQRGKEPAPEIGKEWISKSNRARIVTSDKAKGEKDSLRERGTIWGKHGNEEFRVATKR